MSILQGGYSMFIQLTPIVMLVLVSILSQMLVSTPPYSLYSRPYVIILYNTCLILPYNLFFRSCVIMFYVICFTIPNKLQTVWLNINNSVCDVGCMYAVNGLWMLVLFKHFASLESSKGWLLFVLIVLKLNPPFSLCKMCVCVLFYSSAKKKKWAKQKMAKH